VATGEVQSLATNPKAGVSTTGGVGIEEMKLARKERQEQAFEAYAKRKGYLDVEIELRTGQAARSFKQLLELNDAGTRASAPRSHAGKTHTRGRPLVPRVALSGLAETRPSRHAAVQRISASLFPPL
jgi:hypothetical protein